MHTRMDVYWALNQNIYRVIMQGIIALSYLQLNKAAFTWLLCGRATSVLLTATQFAGKDTLSPDVTGQASSSANISTSTTVPVFILSTAMSHLDCVTSVVQLKEEFQALVRKSHRSAMLAVAQPRSVSFGSPSGLAVARNWMSGHLVDRMKAA